MRKEDKSTIIEQIAATVKNTVTSIWWIPLP